MGYGGKIGEVVSDFVKRPAGSNETLNAMVPALVGFAAGGPLGSYLGMTGGTAGAVGGALAGGLTSAAMGRGVVPGIIGGGLGGYGGGASGGFSSLSSSSTAPGLAAPGAAAGTSGVGTLGYYSPELTLSELAKNGSWLQGGGTNLVGQSAAGYFGAPAASWDLVSPAFSGTQALAATAPAAATTMPFGQQLMQPFARGLQALGFPETATSVAAMNPLANVGAGSMLNLGTGLYGLEQSRQLRQQAMMADPLAQQRAGYAQQLQALQANPSSITGIPGYQAGLEAVQRSLAAQGYQGSGNMMAALQQYGGNAYQQQLQNLYQLAGGNQPGLAMEGNIGAAQLAGQSLNRLALGARSMGF